MTCRWRLVKAVRKVLYNVDNSKRAKVARGSALTQRQYNEK
jgi:hypothetical protein